VLKAFKPMSMFPVTVVCAEVKEVLINKADPTKAIFAIVFFHVFSI